MCSHRVLQVTLPQVAPAGVPGIPTVPSVNVLNFTRALSSLQVPAARVVVPQEVADSAVDSRQLIKCILFLKYSEEVGYNC